MAYTDPRSTRDPGTIALVALVHAGLGYALLTGLAGTFSPAPDRTIDSYAVPPEAPPPDPVPPKPQPRSERAMDRPVTVPVPEVPTPAPLPTIEITDLFPTRLPPPIPGPRLDPLPPADPPATPAIDRAAAARGDPREWVTTADYPTAARRDGLVGTSTIRWEISVSGRAENCTVTRSSGSPVLDRAACAAIVREARYAPALDSAGNPIRSSSGRRVTWTLPED